MEKRTPTVRHDIDWPLKRHDWPCISAVGKVVAKRRLADRAEIIDTRDHLFSAPADVECFKVDRRGHWVPNARV